MPSYVSRWQSADDDETLRRAAAAMTKTKHALLAILACARLAVGLDPAAAREPASFAVDSDGDDSDGDLGDGRCATTQGTCTLRAAIEESNALASPAAAEIRLGAGVLYRLTHADASTESSVDGPSALLILSSIVIAGDGATIQAAPASDVAFRVLLVGRGGRLQAADLTITGGAAQEGFHAGGGVLNRGEFLLTHGSLRQNGAGVGFDASGALPGGGALYNEGSAALIATDVSGNSEHADSSLHGHGGGGILNKGLLTLEGCDIDGNATYGGDFGGDGGGIYNAGDLSIRDSRLRANTTGGACIGGDGGAIYNSGFLRLTGTLLADSATTHSGNGGAILNSGFAQIEDSELRANAAGDSSEEGPGGHGGAVFNRGDLLLVRCTVADNTTGRVDDAFHGSGGDGGGVFNSGTLEVRDSTISGNRTGRGGELATDHGGHGGGIFNGGLLSLINTTISGNRAGDGGRECRPPENPRPSSGGSGGGLYDRRGAVLRNTTIADNAAGRGFACTNDESIRGSDGAGGGVFTTEFAMNNTIVAGNTALGSGPDCSGFAAARFSVIEEISGCELDLESSGDVVVGTPPRLGSLADNGGPTLTHALEPGSPAIDGGDPEGCRDASGQILAADQRGAPRDGRCDIGAFEVASLPTVTPTASPTFAGAGGGGCATAERETAAGAAWILWAALLLLLRRRL